MDYRVECKWLAPQMKMQVHNLRRARPCHPLGIAAVWQQVSCCHLTPGMITHTRVIDAEWPGRVLRMSPDTDVPIDVQHTLDIPCRQ